MDRLLLGSVEIMVVIAHGSKSHQGACCNFKAAIAQGLVFCMDAAGRGDVTLKKTCDI